jgi:hypothetical protein
MENTQKKQGEGLIDRLARNEIVMDFNAEKGVWEAIPVTQNMVPRPPQTLVIVERIIERLPAEKAPSPPPSAHPRGVTAVEAAGVLALATVDFTAGVLSLAGGLFRVVGAGLTTFARRPPPPIPPAFWEPKNRSPKGDQPTKNVTINIDFSNSNF